MHLAEAQRSLGTSIPWLCDDMDGRFSRAMGNAPTSEFIIGPDGKIVVCHGWSNPSRLRGELSQLLGPVEPPTRPEDLHLPEPVPAAAAATGIVPRIERPEFMVPLTTTPVVGDDQEPFYAKLRAEGTRDLLRTGNGKLYLGFLLDPMYRVHWNNLVAPIRVVMQATNKSDSEAILLEGPQVDKDGDADPREFLVTIQNWKADEKRTITVNYFACSDEEGWCKPIQQSYELSRRPARGSGFTFRPEYRHRMLKSLDWRDGQLPATRLSAAPDRLADLAADWSMQTFWNGQPEEWSLHLDYENGELTGWSTFDRAEPEIHVVSFDGTELRFLQLSGPAPEEIIVRLEDGTLHGNQFSPFGDLAVKGTKTSESVGHTQDEPIHADSEPFSESAQGVAGSTPTVRRKRLASIRLKGPRIQWRPVERLRIRARRQR